MRTLWSPLHAILVSKRLSFEPQTPFRIEKDVSSVSIISSVKTSSSANIVNNN